MAIKTQLILSSIALLVITSFFFLYKLNQTISCVAVSPSMYADSISGKLHSYYQENGRIPKLEDFWIEIGMKNSHPCMLGGKFVPLYYNAQQPLPFSKASPKAGHYLALIDNEEVNEKSRFLHPDIARKIDSISDDGLPYSGQVIGAGDPTCFKKDINGLYEYNTSKNSNCAFLYFKLLSDEIETEISTNNGQTNIYEE